MNFGAETFPRNAWNSPQTHEILTPRGPSPWWSSGAAPVCSIAVPPGMRLEPPCRLVPVDPDRVTIDLRPPVGVNVQPDPAHGGGIVYNPAVAEKKSILPLVALGVAAYFLMG